MTRISTVSRTFIVAGSVLAAAVAWLAAARPARAAVALTADEVARRTQATSFDLRAHAEARAAAEAGLDEARAAFLPRLSGVARYTRLSPITPPALGNLVVAPADAQPGSTPDPSTLKAVPFSFPALDNQYVAQATLQVPLSDYILRLPQARAAALGNLRAAALNQEAVRLRVAVEARVAFYAWVLARRQVAVAQQALEQVRGHLADARHAADAGTASPADVLRVDAQVASNELLLTRARNAAAVYEQQLRTLMHDDSGRAYEVGEEAGAEAGDAPMTDTGARDATASLDALYGEAIGRRLELRAMDQGAEATRQRARVAAAAGLPRLDAVANATLANPNPRYLPQEASFRGTWDASVQLGWAPTDLPGSLAARRGALARAAEIDAQRATVADGIKLEITQAAQELSNARASVATARRGLDSARESYRVRRVLYQNGRATSIELSDAETELTRAGFDVASAEIGLRVAHARLEHAVGRDVGGAAPR